MTSDSNGQIERHRAAIIRRDISKPVRLALESEVLSAGKTFFDYGCGHGEDVILLASKGIASAGWDPHFFPESELMLADVVNLGYVINVIESEIEREEVLCRAWELACEVLVVSAQVEVAQRSELYVPYADGVITSRNTFQRYFRQQELKVYIDDVLGVNSIPVDLGVFFVFKDEQKAEDFRASRFRRRIGAPRIRQPKRSYADYQQLLAPLIDFVVQRGRLPAKGELQCEEDIKQQIGSIRRAFRLVQAVTEQSDWDAIYEARRNDWLVYLALRQFSERDKFRNFPDLIKRDIKYLFGSYKNACYIADRLLFSVGVPKVIEHTAKNSRIGKLLPSALYVHFSALNELDPLLRVYEGCVSRTVGRLEHATLVKFHLDKPSISYLAYPTFDDEAHPSLHSSIKISLPDLKIHYRDYSQSRNPPILHRKETFVTVDYPSYEVFKELTLMEEQAGLLNSPSEIGNLSSWRSRLEDKGFSILGHKLFGLSPNR